MKHIYLAFIAIFLVFNSVAQSVADFENLELDPSSYWNGSDNSGGFTSGGVKFNNQFSAPPPSWNGFAYSNMTDVTTASYTNQYSAITGKGNEGSANYALCYPINSADIEFTVSTKVTGFYVTNSTYAYFTMKNGDSFSKKFGGESGDEPDFFKLKIEGLDGAGNVVNVVNFYLADFRFGDNSKDYILNKWAWVDLSAMNAVRKLRFSLSSSDNGAWGMNTPSYFCIDDLNGQKPYEYLPVTYAGMEDVALGPSGYYEGADNAGDFLSGNFRFLNNYSAEWGSWSGFAASNHTDATTAGYGNQYSAITGKGVDGSSAYAVGYPVAVSTILFKETTVSELYVTNSTYAYWSMKNGDDYAKKFGGDNGTEEDYFMLTIEGFDANSQSTGKVEFYLADFRSSDPTKDYIVNTWKRVELKSLGKITRLEFSLTSSDNGDWGINTPGYFCIDHVNQAAVTSSPQIAEVKVSVFPNPFVGYFRVSGITEMANIIVSDITGRKLYEYKNVSNNQSVNGLDQLNAGVYIIEVVDGSSRFSTRLVKK